MLLNSLKALNGVRNRQVLATKVFLLFRKGVDLITTKLFQADCYNIIPTLPDKSIDCVITDPPYNFGSIHGSGMFSEKNYEKYGRTRNITMLRNLEKLDSVVFEPVKLLDMLEPKLKSFYGYFFCNKALVADYINWANTKGYSFDILTMIKKNAVPAHSTHHLSDIEYIILIRGKGTWWQGKGLDMDDYRKWYQTVCTKRIHPAEKPVELLERFVRVSCPKDGVILDPFMGSGSSGVASVRNGRSFIGIEKDDNYFDLAGKRIKETEDDLNGVGTLFEGIE